MPRLLQINVTANWGSTGKIAEDIGRLAMEDGWESWIAYGRGNPRSESNLIRIGNDWDMRWHALQTRLFDNHGLASKNVTNDFLNKIKEIKPDLIHLHNIHGYFINYPLLFGFLKEWGGPVVWTLHDCWPITGHCAHFENEKCDRWKEGCHNCIALRRYPSSLLLDQSKNNWITKKNSFSSIIKQLTLVPVSDWLHNILEHSFLNEAMIKTINNGIDLNIFRPSNEEKENILLGVASVWTDRKGLDDFKQLRKVIPNNYRIVLVGLTKPQIKSLPEGIEGISRTNNINELVNLYSRAKVFVNPTYEDTFPTTNIEALACGTPLVTYRTGGSPEIIDENTGRVVMKGDIEALAESIQELAELKDSISNICRGRAESLYNKNDCFKKYIELYHSVL